MGYKYKGNHRNLSYEKEKDFLESFEKSAEAGRILEIKELKIAYEEKVGKSVGKSIIYNLLSSNSYIAVVSLNLYGGCACRL